MTCFDILWERRLNAESGNSNQANQLLRVQIPENTADLRGMRFEEAMQELETRIHECPNNSVLFVVHGHGTGQLKSGVQKHLKHHVLVKKFEFESKSAGGCTVVELKWLLLHVVLEWILFAVAMEVVNYVLYWVILNFLGLNIYCLHIAFLAEESMAGISLRPELFEYKIYSYRYLRKLIGKSSCDNNWRSRYCMSFVCQVSIDNVWQHFLPISAPWQLVISQVGSLLLLHCTLDLWSKAVHDSQNLNLLMIHWEVMYTRGCCKSHWIAWSG